MRRIAAVVLAVLLATAGAAPVVAAGGVETGATSGPAGPADGSAVAADEAPNASETTDAANNHTTVTLLTYNDIQTAMSSNESVPRMATVIEERRQAHDNPTVLVGGGDQVSPHALSPTSQWRIPVQVLNEIQPDAEVVGNHDLDFGFDAVQNFSDESEFPWLMANVVQSDSGDPIPGTEPYTVVERDGVRVGVVGIADGAIDGKTAVDFEEEGYEIEDHVSTSAEYAQMLKEDENVDVVVVAAHTGIPEAREIANGTENVDAIVVGDDEQYYPPQETSGTVIVEAEARAQYVGEINLSVSDGEVTGWDGRLIATENASREETTDRIITEAANEQLRTTVAETEVPLDATFSSNYHDETNMGNLITDAFRWETGAEVAITNAGGIRSNGVYGPGELTVGDVYSVLPFGNTVVEVELTGAQLRAYLASEVVTLESEGGQQFGAEPALQVSGVNYEYVAHEGADPVVRDLRVNGEPLEDDETVTVAVNSFMYGGSDILQEGEVQERTGQLYGTVFANYLREQGTVDPPGEDRIRRVDREVTADELALDGEGDAEVTFTLPEQASEFNESTVVATTGANRTAAPTDVAVDGREVTLTFADSDLVSLAELGGPVHIYAEYNDSEYERVYFDSSILNVDVPVSVDLATPTPTVTPSPTATPSPGMDEDTPDETTTTSSPGLGPVAALLAVLAATLVATRRD
jgi:5'-nucleotidase/UDP-sugar diphosphatase